MMDKTAILFLTSFLLYCLFVFLAVYACYESNQSECQAYGELTGYEVTMLDGGTCMVNHPDTGWTPVWRER